MTFTNPARERLHSAIVSMRKFIEREKPDVLRFHRRSFTDGTRSVLMETKDRRIAAVGYEKGTHLMPKS